MQEALKIFTGVVEDRMDPLKLNRVRVRCFFIHPIDKTLVPTEDLPWARVANPVLRLKEGDQVKGYFEDASEDYQMPVVTEKVIGIPEDNGNAENGFADPRKEEDLQDAPRFPKNVIITPGKKVEIIEQDEAPRLPARLDEPLTSRLDRNENLTDYLETLAKQRLEDIELGIENLLSDLATNFVSQVENAVISKVQSLINKIPGISVASSIAQMAGFNKYDIIKTYTQPPVPYAAKYPYNNAIVTESGHVQEFDDTPGAERVHTRHRSGTYDEMLPDGDRVMRTVGDQHNIVSANGSTVIQGARTILVEGSDQVIVRGASYVQIEGSSKIVVLGDCELSVAGDMTHKVQGDYDLSVKGDYTVNIEGDFKTTSKGETFVAAKDKMKLETESTFNLKAADDLDITSQAKTSISTEDDLEIKSFQTIKFDAVEDYQIKIQTGMLLIDMIVPGETNQPINISDIVLDPLDPDMTPPAIDELPDDFSTDEFIQEPKIVSDITEAFQKAASAVEQGQNIVDQVTGAIPIPDVNTTFTIIDITNKVGNYL